MDPARAAAAQTAAKPSKQAAKPARGAQQKAGRGGKRGRESRPAKTLEDLDAEMEGTSAQLTPDYAKQTAAESAAQPMEDAPTA